MQHVIQMVSNSVFLDLTMKGNGYTLFRELSEKPEAFIGHKSYTLMQKATPSYKGNPWSSY